jgi:hypothetical protein
MAPSEAPPGWSEWLKLVQTLDAAMREDDWEQSIALAERVLATQPTMPDLALLDPAETARMTVLLQDALLAVDDARALMTGRRDELASLLGAQRNENRLRAAYGDE